MRTTISTAVPSLAQRALELRGMKLPGSTIRMVGGRELQFRFSLTPGRFGRDYGCLLRMRPDSRAPDMFVMTPHLSPLAGPDPIPHIYRHDGAGVLLCLWWPKRREWVPRLKLTETFIPWTEEWLWYFEDWLTTRVWAGGGEHPEPPRVRRFARRPAGGMARR
jgi:hypothetical protein